MPLNIHTHIQQQKKQKQKQERNKKNQQKNTKKPQTKANKTIYKTHVHLLRSTISLKSPRSPE